MKRMNKKLVQKLSILEFAKMCSRISVELIKCIKHNPALYAKLRMNRKHFKSKITREKKFNYEVRALRFTSLLFCTEQQVQRLSRVNNIIVEQFLPFCFISANIVF